jgi:hypothetical protein
MSRFNDADDPRRRILIQALAAGVFAGGIAGGPAMAQQFFGSTPRKLSAGRSIYRLSGAVTVDGQPATIDTRIFPTSVVETGKDGEVVFAVGENAFIMRPNSRMQLEPSKREANLLSGLNLLAGKVLSVFAKSRDPIRMTTKVASIGIRGTGVYMESEPDQTYFCTCYGIADIASNADPESKETVAAKYHDKPLYILADQQSGKNIRNAPFINHTDQELMLVETLVGRTPPFVFPKDDYSGPRRNY